VLGFVHPGRILTKGGARPGDVLVLTKPLGFGTVTTALKHGLADPTDVSEAVGWMKRLNRQASRLALDAGLHGGTDITGYSLLGHASEIAQASRVGLRIVFDKIPFTRGALRYAEDYIFPGGATDNLQFFGPNVRFAPHLGEPFQMLLFDPQTSGGLLLCVPSDKLDRLLQEASRTGELLTVIGEVTGGEGIEVV
jgi:selenide,water dikinase